MDVDRRVLELKHSIEKRRYSINSLESFEEQLDGILDTEYDLLLAHRIALINRYIEDEKDEDEIFDLDPVTPFDLFTSVREILDRDPPVFVIKELLLEHDFDDGDLLQLRRHDDIDIIEEPLDNAPTVEIIHMVET